jgi:hypothetical protein
MVVLCHMVICSVGVSEHNRWFYVIWPFIVYVRWNMIGGSV